ncbi:MAG: hypothetical protein ACRC9Y_14030 [Aeromonas veronii]
MAIRKAKVNSGFTVMLNKSMQDKNLSFEATGLLAMMLSLPDDWDIHKSWLQLQKQKCGRDKLTNMMKELIDAGYVVKRFKQKDDGRMDGVDWFVYPEPVTEKQAAELENRTTGNPVSGDDDTTKNTSLQNKQNTKEPLSSASQKDESLNDEKVINTWNDIAKQRNFKGCRIITDTVRKNITKIYAFHCKEKKSKKQEPLSVTEFTCAYLTHGFEKWAGEFYSGQTGYRADLEYATRKAIFEKVYSEL